MFDLLKFDVEPSLDQCAAMGSVQEWNSELKSSTTALAGWLVTCCFRKILMLV